MAAVADIFYDRRVSPGLLGALATGGPLHGLVQRATADRLRFDIQLRGSPKSRKETATLYYGLTSLLDIKVSSGGRWRLGAHDTHRAAGNFDADWLGPRSLAEVAAGWPAIDGYLDRALVVAETKSRYFAKEGRVHASLCSGTAAAYRVIDREANVGFASNGVKTSVCVDLASPIRRAVSKIAFPGRWWDSLRSSKRSLGTGLDVLAVDAKGRLLVIEAKPPGSTDGVAWAPAQVRFYAELFARWYHACPEPTTILEQMLAQRAQIGLAAPGSVAWPELPQIVPVVAIGDQEQAACSARAIERLWQLDEALANEPHIGAGIAALEVWQLDRHGNATMLVRP